MNTHVRSSISEHVKGWNGGLNNSTAVVSGFKKYDVICESLSRVILDQLYSNVRGSCYD